MIFMDGLRTDVVWIIWVLISALAFYLIWAPKIARGLRKNVMRAAGTLLGIVFLCASLVLGVGILMGANPPREHTNRKADMPPLCRGCDRLLRATSGSRRSA